MHGQQNIKILHSIALEMRHKLCSRWQHLVCIRKVQSVHYSAEITQDTQCRYNVTMRRVRATIVAVVRQRVTNILKVCLCLVYPE